MSKITAMALSGAIVLLISTSTYARPDTRKMSCQEARSLVARSGGVVLSTGARTYDRFVASIRFCQPYERLKRRWVPTRDQKSCFIGYSCEPADDSYDGIFGYD